MADIARFFRFDSQPPLIQLIFSFCIVVVAGTLLFWLFIIIGSLIFHVAPGKLIQLPVSNPGNKGRIILKYIQFSQQAGLFLLPTLLTSYLIRKDDESFLKLSGLPRLLNLILVVSLAILILPLINFTGVLNSRMALPESFSGIQEWMKTKEEVASRLTELLITSSGIQTLGINIFILAIVPAFCEEILFRGLFQQLLCRLFRSSHAGIWITSILFSTIHLQFFGFIPRLILGLVFGYLFYWSGNLWYSIIAHFVNNVIPVIVSYFNAWNETGEPIAGGKENFNFPFATVLISGLILFYFWREFRRRSVSGDIISR
jgi:membrane protease YdiL (CAAX protease family)